MILERPEAVLSGYSLFHLDETPTSSVDADYKDVLFLSASRYPQFPQLVPYRTFDFFNSSKQFRCPKHNIFICSVL